MLFIDIEIHVVERDDANALMLQYQESENRHKKRFLNLENEVKDIIE